ncbi:MAG: DUF6151 family protein [Novosphingobium sp.]
MNMKTLLRCQCGAVECSGTCAPFLSAVCYCDDCQNAARQIEAIGKGPAISEPDGGTALCLIRDDQFTIEHGADLLKPHQLDPTSATCRMIASCCNSAIYLEFSDGRFWKSAMIGRILGTKPPIEMRLCTKYRSSNLPWPDDAPRHAGFPLSAFARVGWQWLAMKLGR